MPHSNVVMMCYEEEDAQYPTYNDNDDYDDDYDD